MEFSINVIVYLKVLYMCEDVVKNINVLNYRLLRLLFVEKGWIIFFKVLLLFLEDIGCFWFIGIVIKSKFEIREKNVILILVSLFDYDYVILFYFLIFLLFFGGIVVVLWVLFCFRELYKLVMEDEYIDDLVVSFLLFMVVSY